MNPIFRRILAVVTGIGVGGLVITVFERINSAMFPLPDGVDLTDPAALGRAIADAGPSVLFGVALGYFWGAFVGGWISTSISNSTGRLPAGIVTGFFLLGAVFTLFAFPHPIWFWFVGPASVAVGGHFGWMKGRGSVESRLAAQGVGEPADA